MADEVNKFQELIAKSLAGMNEEAMREVIGECLRKKLEEYDCKSIIERAITPIITTMVKEFVKDQAVLEVLQNRAKSQLLTVAGSFELKCAGRY